MNKEFLILLLSASLLMGCSKDATENGAVKIDAQSVVSDQKKQAEKVPPEDDPQFTGTPVLGFKLRDSTFESVKKRLANYSVLDYETYAGGPALENDGSGFNIEGLLGTQFGFDKDNKLVYVWMALKEQDHMSKATYKKIVQYVKQNNYEVTHVKSPFVGNQLTEFKTSKNEKIIVSEPHMGGFKVYVEYFTDEFDKQRTQSLQEQEVQKVKSESANF